MSFTASGYKKKTAAELKEELSLAVKNADRTFDSLNSDVQNNLLDTEVPVLLAIQNLCAEIANGYAPGFANDFMKEQLASSLGLRYKDAANSSVVLKFSGPKGSYIPKDLECGGFSTTASAIIGDDGFVNITATAEGDVSADVNSITSMSVDISGVSVTNPSASTPYVPQETPQQLWERAQRMLRNPRTGTLDYAIGQISAIGGIPERLINFRVFQNGAEKTIEAIIGGGDSEKIAHALFESFLQTECLTSSPSGDESSRTIKWPIVYRGSQIPITWTSAKELKLAVSIKVSFKYVAVFEGKLAEATQRRFADELNNRRVGLPLNRNLLTKMVYDAITIDMGVDLQYCNRVNITLSSMEGDAVGDELSFDANSYLSAQYHDVYTMLGLFELKVVA